MAGREGESGSGEKNKGGKKKPPLRGSGEEKGRNHQPDDFGREKGSHQSEKKKTHRGG